MFKRRSGKDEDKKALPLLSSAAFLEERLHEPALSRNADRTATEPVKGDALPPLDEGSVVDGKSRSSGGAGAPVHEGDAIEAKEHEATAQRAHGLLSSLREETDMLQRAQIVAEHTQENGGLPVHEARLVMAMTRHKRLEVEHRQRLTAVKVDGEDDNDNKDDVGSQENEEVDEFEDYDVLMAKAKAAKQKAAKFEQRASRMAKQVRDLEKDLAGSEQKCATLEGKMSDLQQQCTRSDHLLKSQSEELSRVKAELENRNKKVAMLESRVVGANFGDASLTLTASTKPAASKDNAGGGGAGFWRKLRGKGGKDDNELSSEATEALTTSNATTTTAPVTRARVRQGEWGKAVARTSGTDFPGQPTGAVLEPGEEFKYLATKEVNLPLVRPNGVPITYYELADGRGWVPDYTKVDPNIILVEPIDEATNQTPSESQPQPPDAQVESSSTGNGRISVTSTPSKAKKGAAKKPLIDEEPKVLDVKFEGSDPSLGLMLIPTRFGLEVGHVSGALPAHLDVPIGALVHSINGILLNTAVTSAGEEKGDKEGAKESEGKETFKVYASASTVTEESFRSLVAAVLPRPVKIGFLVDSEHRAVLQNRLRKVEADLKASEELTRALRKELEVIATRGGGGPNNQVIAASNGSPNSSSSKQGRPTLKQRQETLQATQQEAKQATRQETLQATQQEAKQAAAAEAPTKKKGTNGSSNSSGETDLPEYLKHLSKPQKKKYTDLVASERDLTVALEDSKVKIMELEERCELANEDAAEMRALLAVSEASLGEAEKARGQLEKHLSTLQDVSEKFDSSVKSMAVKEERLLWLENEVRRQRDELLSVAAVRGDAQDLKQWLDEERVAHDRQARSLHSLIGKLQKEVASYSYKDCANAAAKREQEALQAQRMEAHKKREQELLEVRKKQHGLVTDAVRDLVVDLADSVALACESATTTTTLSPLSGSAP